MNLLNLLKLAVAFAVLALHTNAADRVSVRLARFCGSKVVRPAARRLHLDRVRFAKGGHLGITLGICMSG